MASDTLLRIAIFMFPQKTMTLYSLWPLPDPLTIHSLGPQPYCKWQPWDRQSTHSWSFPGWSDSISMHQCSVLSVLPCSPVPMVTLDLKSSLDGKYAVHNIAYYITSHPSLSFWSQYTPYPLHSSLPKQVNQKQLDISIGRFPCICAHNCKVVLPHAIIPKICPWPPLEA